MRNHILKMSAVAALLTMAAAGSAMAATTPTRADVETRYQHQRANCLAGRTGEDQATCLKEAGAARNEGMRGINLNEGSPDYRQNQLERCKVFVDVAEARECRLRVEQGNVSGSVRDGGVIRELTIVEQKPPTVLVIPAPPAPAPAPTPDPAPQ